MRQKALCVAYRVFMNVIDSSAGGGSGSSLDEFGVFFWTYQENMLTLSLASLFLCIAFYREKYY